MNNENNETTTIFYRPFKTDEKINLTKEDINRILEDEEGISEFEYNLGKFDGNVLYLYPDFAVPYFTEDDSEVTNISLFEVDGEYDLEEVFDLITSEEIERILVRCLGTTEVNREGEVR